GIQNVVFLCGDYHASMTTTLEFGSGDPAENHKARSLRAYCVVASGLYSPLPFANTRLDELVHDTRGDTVYGGDRRYTVRTCAGRTLDYKMDNATEKSGFTILDVEKTGQGWRLTVDVRDTNGAQVKINTYPL
ncbi:MAG: hypothetical protein JNL33_13120, partial [Betaproteobacteria bacterium]|nr:hypothetical protein [Betaproteobacteria bacterium]